MSTEWDLFCIDCQEGAGFSFEGAIGETMLADLWAAREPLAALAGVRIGGGTLNLTHEEAPLRPWWFAAHKDHHVRRRNEYGGFAGDCGRRAPCPTCKRESPCVRAEKHEGACSIVAPSPVPGSPEATARARYFWGDAIQRLKEAVPFGYDRSPTDLLTDLEGAIGAELERAAREGMVHARAGNGHDLRECSLPPSGVIRLAQPLSRQTAIFGAIATRTLIELPPLPGLWIVHRMARVDMERIVVEASPYIGPAAEPTPAPTTSRCPPNEDGVPCVRGALDPDHTGICMGTEKGGGSVSWWRPDLAARAASEEPTPR